MTPRRAPAKHVYLAEFAKKDLDDLVHRLWTERNFDTSPVILLGAVVHAATKLPVDLVQALVPGYLERERQELGEPATEDEAKSG